MTVLDPGSTSGLVARVKGILLKPDPEWDVIDGEPSTINSIYMGYAAPLAAIPAVCSALGQSLIGVGAFGIHVKVPLLSAIVSGVIGYVLALVSLFVLALIIEALAPSFGGTKDRLKAFKVAAYASTAGWVGGIFLLIPALGILAALAGVYGLFLLYKGLPKLMKSPSDKSLPYVAVIIVAAIVVYIVIGAITAAIVGATVGLGGLAGGLASQSSTMTGKVKVGDTELDLAKLEAASKQMEQTAKQMQAAAEGKTADGATIQPVPSDVLKAMLPAAIGGFNRTELESSSGGVGGMQGANARGVYKRGDGSITLEVTDMAAAGGLAGLAGAFNVNSSRETATGYEKMSTINGRMTQEEFDNASKSGKYAVMVGNRFMVAANGSAVTMNDLKAAVSTVGLDQLERLAKG